MNSDDAPLSMRSVAVCPAKSARTLKRAAGAVRTPCSSRGSALRVVAAGSVPCRVGVGVGVGLVIGSETREGTEAEKEEETASESEATAGESEGVKSGE